MIVQWCILLPLYDPCDIAVHRGISRCHPYLVIFDPLCSFTMTNKVDEHGLIRLRTELQVEDDVESDPYPFEGDGSGVDHLV